MLTARSVPGFPEADSYELPAEHAMALAHRQSPVVVDAGIGDRVHFQVAAADAFRGQFDLICFFDCLHDMGDPVGIATHAMA